MLLQVDCSAGWGRRERRREQVNKKVRALSTFLFFTYTQMYPAEQVVTNPSSWEVAMLKLRMQFTKSRPVYSRKKLTNFIPQGPGNTTIVAIICQYCDYSTIPKIMTAPSIRTLTF